MAQSSPQNSAHIHGNNSNIVPDDLHGMLSSILKSLNDIPQRTKAQEVTLVQIALALQHNNLLLHEHTVILQKHRDKHTTREKKPETQYNHFNSLSQGFD